jgi:hypothetical protein
MYLNALDVLEQPKREPSREELSELLLLCRRDALMAEDASGRWQPLRHGAHELRW